MAGLYIHIPFCRSRCIYCGFYSTTCLSRRRDYVDALCAEMRLRAADALFSRQIDTVYLGGGTPSLLTAEQLRRLFLYIYNVYDVSPEAEVTMECNPDDIDDGFVKMLSQLPVNRVSMGAQTFSDARLRFLHRRHRAEQVVSAVGLLRGAGISNISIDLMYGFPNETIEEWHADIDAALSLGVEHISAYALSYEPGTPLSRMLEKGSVSELDEEIQRQMYYDLKDRLESAGYEHYELSNFAKIEEGEKKNGMGFRSRHNSSYWNHTAYLGIGAGAHSYDGKRHRQWNVSDLDAYIRTIGKGSLPAEGEDLDDDTFYDEQVMTRLRTSEGLPLAQLPAPRRAWCLSQASKWMKCGWLCEEDNHLRLTREGLFVSDAVISSLFS
ncbi:MAG: radical SAM family heme chaperone HemW [Prevotella sp.]|nr:radical SAM family heme chaperone HemW [Prevotella sp.]